MDQKRNKKKNTTLITYTPLHHLPPPSSHTRVTHAHQSPPVFTAFIKQQQLHRVTWYRYRCPDFQGRALNSDPLKLVCVI